MHFPTLTTTLTLALLPFLALAHPTSPNTTTAATPADLPDLASLDPSLSLAPPPTLVRRLGETYAYSYNPVKLCDHANGGGACVIQSFRHNLCYNLDKCWNDRVSSVYPQWGRTKCRLHADRNCRGGNIVVGPGWSIQNLKLNNMNDRISSLDCFTIWN